MGPAQIIPTIPTNFEAHEKALNFTAVLIYQSSDGDY
jgi:hypothetical protein